MSSDFVQIELDLSEIKSVHTGGMVMDDSSPSEDIYEDPYVITKNGVRHRISRESALALQSRIGYRSSDDFGTPGG